MSLFGRYTVVLNWHQFSFDLYFVDTVHIDSQFLFLVNFFYLQSLLSTRTPYEEFHRLFKSVPMDQFPINGRYMNLHLIIKIIYMPTLMKRFDEKSFWFKKLLSVALLIILFIIRECLEIFIDFVILPFCSVHIFFQFNPPKIV